MADVLANEKALTSTQEDYLEAILELTDEKTVARNMELASRLGVKRATVTRALKLLTQKGLVEHEMNGYITLTELGKTIACDIRDRHELFRHFFHDILELEESEADGIACRIEHAVSGEALSKFRKFIKHADECEHICPNSCKAKEGARK